MRRCSSTQTGGRGRRGGGLGQVPSSSALAGPAQHWDSPQLLTRDPLCPWWDCMWSKTIFPETVPWRRRARLPGRGSPGSKAGHLASPPKTAAKNCCGKSDGPNPNTPHLLPPQFPFLQGWITLCALQDCCRGKLKSCCMSHDLVYLLMGGGAGTVMAHSSYQGGPFPSAPLSKPCPAPSFPFSRVPLHRSWPVFPRGQGAGEGAASLDGGEA